MVQGVWDIYTVWTVKYTSPTFWRTVMPSSSVSSSPTACFTLTMKTIHPLETLVTMYQSSWRNITEGLNLHQNHCEHLRFLALSCFHLETQLLRIYFSSFIFPLSFSVTRLNISSAHKHSFFMRIYLNVLTSFVCQFALYFCPSFQIFTQNIVLQVIH